MLALQPRRGTHPQGTVVNARVEDCWTLRERFEQGEIDIDPDDDKFASQLGSTKWGIDSRGRIKIESKDDMRKRGLPSPDWADACHRLCRQGECSTDECGQSRRRKHHRRFDDEGLVTAKQFDATLLRCEHFL